EVFLTNSTPPTNYRKVFTFRFNEPMDTNVTRVTLHEALSPDVNVRAFNGAWNDSQNLTVTVLHETPGVIPLLEDAPYYLDVTALKDVAGNLVDAAVGVLGDGHLDFRTSLSDVDLNHACQEAL